MKSAFTPVGTARFLLDSETNYYSTELAWHPGDLLVLYSDGITEAFNAASEMYGVERFKTLLSETQHLSAAEIKQAVLADLEAHQRGAAANDDITLIIAKFR